MRRRDGHRVDRGCSRVDRTTGATPDHARFHCLLTDEWIKLRSLRSTPWALLISALAIIGANVNAAIADYTNFPNYAASQQANFLSSALFDAFTDIASQVVVLGSASPSVAWQGTARAASSVPPSSSLCCRSC